MLCIMLVYLVQFAALFNAVSLHHAFFPLTFINAFCFHALSWVIDTVCLFAFYYASCTVLLICWFSKFYLHSGFLMKGLCALWRIST